MKTAKDVLKSIKDNDVKYVDLRFTDPRGKWQHVTFDIGMIDEEIFRRRHDVRRLVDRRLEGDQRIRHVPDARPGHRDDRSVLRRDHHGHHLRRAGADHRRALQPRPARHRQEGRGDGEVDGRRRHRLLRPGSRVLRVRRRPLLSRRPTTPASSSNSSELPTNSDTEYEGGNLGHRIRTKGGYFPVPPQDSVQDMRSEMLGAMAKMGVKVEKHHHEVASAQHELGMKFDTHDADGRPDADLQILHPPGRAHLRQDRHLHAEAGLWRQRLGHALPPVDLEGRQAGIRRQQVRRPVGDLPVLHRRHHQARQGDQRLHQPVDQLLQAPGPGL